MLGHNDLVETDGLATLHVVRVGRPGPAIDLQLRGPEVGKPGPPAAHARRRSTSTRSPSATRVARDARRSTIARATAGEGAAGGSAARAVGQTAQVRRRCGRRMTIAMIEELNGTNCKTYLLVGGGEAALVDPVRERFDTYRPVLARARPAPARWCSRRTRTPTT